MEPVDIVRLTDRGWGSLIMLNPTENFIRSNEDLLLNFMAQSTQNGSYLDADVRIGHKPFPFLNFSPIR